MNLSWTMRLALWLGSIVAAIAGLSAFGTSLYRQLEPVLERIFFYGIRLALVVVVILGVSTVVSDVWSKAWFDLRERFDTWRRGYPRSQAQRDYDWHHHEWFRLSMSARFGAASEAWRLAEKAWIEVEKERREEDRRTEELLRKTRAMIASWKIEGSF